MAYRLFKNQRKGTWYYVRRVPIEYSHVDPRGTIRRTTGIRIANDQHGVAARRVAEGFDAAEESRWAGLAGDGTAMATAEYLAACQAATKLGNPHRYRSKPRAVIAELLERIERLERGNVGKDKANVAALLDAAPIPDLTFRQCAEQYIDTHKAGWSQRQARRAVAIVTRAIRLPYDRQSCRSRNCPAAPAHKRSRRCSIRSGTPRRPRHRGCAAALRRFSTGRGRKASATATIRRDGKDT